MFDIIALLNQNTFMLSLFMLTSFFLLGAGIKYVDDAFDERTFNKKIAIILAPLLGILWAFTMAIDSIAATLLLAILLAVLFKGKIDNMAHIAGFLSIIVLLFFLNVFSFLLVPLVFITLAGIIDEIGNDFADKKGRFSSYYYFNLFWLKFFEYRITMKLAVLAFALLGYYPLFYFVAFFLFDLGYHLLTIRSTQLTRMRRFTYVPDSILL